jgi:hypothetical protein
MFSNILYEFKAMNLDEEAYLEHFLSLVEKGLDPEPGVQDFDKFHNGVTNGAARAKSDHANLDKQKYKSRKHKRAHLTRVRSRLGQLRHASDTAARFAKASGKHDLADVHTDTANDLHHRQIHMDTDVPSAEKKKK